MYRGYKSAVIVLCYRIPSNLKKIIGGIPESCNDFIKSCVFCCSSDQRCLFLSETNLFVEQKTEKQRY